MNTIPFSEDVVPVNIQSELLKIHPKTRTSFLAILANTWKRQNNNQKIL